MRKHTVGTKERWAEGLGGATFAFWGLRRMSLPGLLAAAAGAALAWRGVSGRPGLFGVRGIDRTSTEPTVGNLGVKIDRDVIVAAPPERLYRFWRNFENLPRIMSHVERVEVLSETRSRWHVKTPVGVTVSWEAEIINDLPPHLIAWRTVPGSSVSHAGSVRFTTAGNGTRIEASLQYDPPGGTLTHAAAKVMDADAGRMLEHDLQEFKRALESGRLAA